MSVMITTTVSLDAQHVASQTVIHLNVGDSKTRRLRLVPTNGGAIIDMGNVSQAFLRAYSSESDNPLLISGEIGDNYFDFQPTAALVAGPEEWSCQLVLLDSNSQTLSSVPFTIVVHANVWLGDVVEHTNTTLTELQWDQSTLTLTARLKDGTGVSKALPHGHPAASGFQNGFMTSAQWQQLVDLATQVDQDVSQDGNPTFASVTVGDVTISGDGTITGVRFT